MSVLIGYDLWNSVTFSDDSPSLQSVKYAEFSNAIIDEIDVRQKTNQGMTNVKDTWQPDTSILAKFVNTLEAGNISNEGVRIVKFKIVRRLVNQEQNDDIYLGEIPFEAGTDADVEFIDSTQPNTNLIYTIIPVGENGLDGTPREIEINESAFVGWWLVDKENNEVLPFDRAIGSVGNVEGTLNQDKTVLETFSKYPQIYYGQKEYHSFSLTTTILPEENERSGDTYLNILTKFIRQHKPFIIKAANGMVYVADIGNPRFSTPLNTWSGYDPLTITIDCTEVQDYASFMKGE